MKKYLSILALLLSVVMLFTACGQNSTNQDQKKTEAEQTTAAEAKPDETKAEQKDNNTNKDSEGASLADWNGDWNSITAYLDDPALQPMLEEHAKEDKASVDDVKKELSEGKEVGYKAMKVDGDKVTFFDGMADKGGKEIASYTYSYVKKYKATHGKHEFFWFEFKANEADAKFPVLLMMPIHGEESLTHFHARVGKDAAELLDQKGFPTFVKSTTTVDQVKEELAEHDHDHDHDHEHGDEAHDHDHDHDHEGAMSLEDWAGTWNNMGAYLNDEGLKAAFEALAKKENKSVDEAKKAYEKKRQCDFNGLVIEGNKITFLDNFKDKDGKEITAAEYEYVTSHKTKHGNHELVWAEFKAKDANAKYPVLLMMPIHGEESLTHFHMRYGANAEELLKIEGWFPTFVKPSSTIEQLADEISE